MLLFGPKLTTVFASRWKALLWAGGILLAVYWYVPRAQDDADQPLGVDQPGEAAQTAASSAPVSPWAK